MVCEEGETSNLKSIEIINDMPNSTTNDDKDIEMRDKESNDDGKKRYNLPVGDVFCFFKKGNISSPLDILYLTMKWLAINKTQILSGITVALAQIPEAVSFSFVAGVSPTVGLQSAWIMGICTSLFGGRPGMVAGATAAVAVVLPSLVRDYGMGYMFYAVMLGGIIEMLFGILRLGKIIRMMPHPVMIGFCNGLGIVIGLAQFNIFKVRPEEDHGGHRSLSEIGGAFAPFTNGYPWVDGVLAAWMCFQIAVTLCTYMIWPKVVKLAPILSIPGSLAAIILSTAVEWAFIRQIGFSTDTVADLASVAGSFPLPVWIDYKNGYPEMLPPLNGETIKVILPVSITVAAIGLLESLLTLEIIDDLTNTKGNNNREAFGQGLGQFLSGAFGGMGGCTTIGQSMMNIHSGGYTRLSSSVAAIFMLIIILAAYKLINIIPVASLAGVMLIVTYFTIEWESFWIVLAACLPQKIRQKYGLISKVKRSDVFVMLSVVAVTLILDLAIAVGVGIIIAVVVFAWDSGNYVKLDRTLSEDRSTVLYTLSGPIFFGSVKPLMSLFPDLSDEPKNAIIFLEHADIYDWSGMVAIKALHEKFRRFGIEVKFEKLKASSHRLMSKSASLWEGSLKFDDLNQLEFENDPHLCSHLHVEKQH